MNLNALTGVACCFLLAASALAPPTTDATPLSASCPDAPTVISVPSFTVPLGIVRTLPGTTTVRATVVDIQGTLTTADATDGRDAPGLCIETETLALGSAAVLCTGSGRDGADAAGATASGGDGTNGGPLSLYLRDAPATITLPALRLLPGAVICTGSGGDGGDGVAVPTCEDLDAFRNIPCDGEGVPCVKVGCLCPDGPAACLPSCQDLDTGVPCDPLACTHDPIPGTPTITACLPICEDLMQLVMADLGLGCTVPPLGPILTPVIPTCVRDALPAFAQGGNGGDAGPLTLDSGAASTAALPTGILRVGNGGDGGRAFALSTGDRDGSATGGAGGRSTGSFPALSAAQIAAALGSSTGGSGGAAFAAPVDCDAAIKCLPDPYAINCFIGLVAEQVCATDPGGDGCAVLTFCASYYRPFPDCFTTGDPGAPEAKVGTPGLGGGQNGNNGKDAKANASFGIGLPMGVGVTCEVDPATPGDPGTLGDSGKAVPAKGGDGDEGLLQGGNGGYAYSKAGDGHPGGAGGKGGNGFPGDGLMCAKEWCAPGGAGGPGGASGSSEAKGGAGGKSGYGRGGDGGSATVEVGAGGVGGNGGDGGIGQPNLPTNLWIQCKGGCPGKGGEIGAMTAEPGKGGTGATSSMKGEDGAESGTFPGGQRSPDGLPGSMPPADCP